MRTKYACNATPARSRCAGGGSSTASSSGSRTTNNVRFRQFSGKEAFVFLEERNAKGRRNVVVSKPSVRVQLTIDVHRSCLNHRGTIARVDPHGRVPNLSEVINGLLHTKILEIEADDKLVLEY